MVNEREKLIGARLRAFRETLQIPRSRFAVTIGFGSDRIASYEAGRAPVLYVVFLAALEKYSISPQWLATGVGSPKWPEDDRSFILQANYSHRDLFSSVYDKQLAKVISKKVFRTGIQMDKTAMHLDLLCESLKGIDRDSSPEVLINKVENLQSRIEQLQKQITDDLELRRKVRMQGNAKKDLTNVTDCANLAPVKAKLPTLLKRLNEATKERGTKTALAKFMGVPLPNISQWLSGEREPSGETTLQLLNWVEQQERQK